VEKPVHWSERVNDLMGDTPMAWLHPIQGTTDPERATRSPACKVNRAIFVSWGEEKNMTNPETDYLLRRARDEALLAIRAEHPAAAAAHQGMAVRYSTQALIELADKDGDVAPSRRPVPAADAQYSSG
jgi:hypothetical protein